MGLPHSWHPKCYLIEQAISLLGCGSAEVMPIELGGNSTGQPRGSVRAAPLCRYAAIETVQSGTGETPVPLCRTRHFLHSRQTRGLGIDRPYDRHPILTLSAAGRCIPQSDRRFADVSVLVSGRICLGVAPGAPRLARGRRRGFGNDRSGCSRRSRPDYSL